MTLWKMRSRKSARGSTVREDICCCLWPELLDRCSAKTRMVGLWDEAVRRFAAGCRILRQSMKMADMGFEKVDI